MISTKEKINTYPPLFNTLFVAMVWRTGYFFEFCLIFQGFAEFFRLDFERLIFPSGRSDTSLTPNCFSPFLC